MTDFSHFNEHGESHMVDVGGKEITQRLARAQGRVLMQAETLRLIMQREVAKGDVLEVARLAGIMAAKRTGELIPLCHPLGLCLLYTSPSPRDRTRSRMPSSA